ncbi:MAG: transaldolase [Candidatus Omnitrophica bacterium]|nr:transaldolase [Candidatus Omnitrophota bacterium]
MDTQTQKTNPLLELKEQGQAIWLDHIQRSLMTSGELQRLIDEDGLSGMTSNPAIFEKAIVETTDYNNALPKLSHAGLEPKAIYEKLAVEDIRLAASIFEPVYRQTNGDDGYVSMEVSPHLACDTRGTIQEARRLWDAINRPNVMIKVPATAEGMGAIEELTALGINVNVTLIFSLDVYQDVAEAYIRGMKRLSQERSELSGVQSVASFFVSRIDTVVDKAIDQELSAAPSQKKAAALKSIRGKTAIANAKLAYERWEKIFSSGLWRKLQSRGAKTQRLLWASTGTKDPNYRDVLYVESLIGPQTINTMPPATFKAFKDHGQVSPTLTENIDQARATMNVLQTMGISFKVVTDQLLVDAVEKFLKPFDSLLAKLSDRAELARAQDTSE